MLESLRSVDLKWTVRQKTHDRQNALFDVRCWTFDVQRSLVSFAWSDRLSFSRRLRSCETTSTLTPRKGF